MKDSEGIYPYYLHPRFGAIKESLLKELDSWSDEDSPNFPHFLRVVRDAVNEIERYDQSIKADEYLYGRRYLDQPVCEGNDTVNADGEVG